MRSSIPSHVSLLVVCFAPQCGKEDEKAASASGTSTGVGSSASTSSGCGSDCPASSSFDACGGLIVTSSGIDPDEYVKQANLFDVATVDCRLGPDFSAYHGAKEGRQLSLRSDAFGSHHSKSILRNGGRRHGRRRVRGSPPDRGFSISLELDERQLTDLDFCATGRLLGSSVTVGFHREGGRPFA